MKGRSKRNANPESKKKKFKKYHKQLKEKNNNKLSSPQDMLSSITKELKEQLVTDMNHGKRKTDRQKNNVPNTIMKNNTDGKTNNNNNNNNSRSKAVPPIHLVKKITEEIYNNLDQRYPLHKSGNTALNSRVTVIRARPGEGDQFLPIQHAPIQVRLNKKTGEYQIRYINKDATINSPDSVRFFNGSIHEDKAKRKQMWQQFDERLRNVKAGMTAALTVTTENTPVTEASSSHEKRTRKKRRRVVKKIVRVRRRKTTTQEPTELSDTVKTNEEFETDDILDIRRSKEKYIKMKKVVTKRRGRKRKVTEKPTFISTDIFREKIQSPEMSETVSNISSTHTTYAVSSSEGEKSMYFTSVKPVTTTISSTQLSTIMGTQSKPSLVASTELPQTVSVKPVIRNVTSYSSYLYSKYDTIGTMTRVVTTVTSAQRPRTTIAQETSDEFLMSSSETTKRSILVTTRKSWERPKHVMPVTFYRTSKATEYPKIHITTETVKRSGPTTAASVRRSKEMFNLTMARERVETLTYSTALPRGTVTDESYKTSKTQSSVSAVDNEVDNTTLFTTSKTLTSTCEYSTETTTEGTTELSEDISNDTTRLTTFATIVPNVSADVIGSTISEVTTETVRETTEEPTLPWRPPTVVFKVYDFPTVSPPFSKTERTKQPKVFRGGRLKGGWYDRYAPYSSRSLGGRYKPQQPATYKPYWDNQWNRYSGRYNRGRKHVLPKYTWQRGRWLPADIPESATPMPVAAMVSVESTSLAEIGTSPVSMKLDDEYVTPTTYEDLMTLSATDEQWTTIIPSTETQHETLSISEEHMISSSVRKEDHPTVVPYQQTTHITSSSHRPQTTVEPHQQTLVTSSSQKTQTTTDPYQQTYKTSSSHKPQTTVVPYQQTYATSSHKPEKTIQPTEIYKRIASQTSAEEEYTTLTTPYNKFLTTLLPTEKHMHHVTEYVSEPTSSESEDTLPTEKHMHHVTEYVSEPTSSESEGTLSTEKHMHHVTEYVSEPTSSESEDMLPTKKHTHHVTEYVSEPTSLESEGTLPTEKHMHHVTEYVSEPTSSEFEDTVHSMEHKKFTTARSFPMDRHSVQSPLIKTYTLSTVLSMLDHTTLHPVTEKHTTSVEDYISEFLQELDAHTTRIPFSAAPTLKYTTPPTVAPSTIKEVHTTSEPLPQKPVMPKEVPSYKGPKFEWPVFDTKKIFTTVSPLSDILLQSPHLEQVHEDTVKSDTQTSKGESTSIKHTDESFSYGEKMLHSTGESIVIEPTSIGVDYVTATPTTEDEYSLLKVVPDTDLVSEEDGVLKKIFVNPFKKVKKFFKDSFESESVERHYINYDEPNGTEEYDFNDIYNEPYFDKNATKAHFTEMRFKGTYVTVRTIYRRPSNFTFPPTPPRTKRPTTQPPPTKATTKPPKLGIFGFMKHKAKNAFKNFANFFTPELNDEEEEMRIMRKNVMVEEDEDDDDEH